MANYFDQPLATTAGGGNTGIPSADVSMGLVTGLFLTPTNASIEDSDLATLQATMNAATVATAATRWLPVGPILGNEDQTIEAVLSAAGYGQEFEVKGEIAGYQLQVDGGIGLNKSLIDLNNRVFNVVFRNDSKYLIGRESATDGLQGILCRVNVSSPKFEDGSEKKFILVTVKALETRTFNNVKSIACDFDPASIDGILGAELVQEGASGATTKFQVRENISKVDLTETYKVELADEGNWSVTERGGANVTAFTATYNAGDNTVSIATGLAVPGTYIIDINLANAATLYAELGAKYEGKATSFTFTVTE